MGASEGDVALRCLALLACGAPDEVVRPLVLRAMEPSRRDRLRRLAALSGLQSLLSHQAARLGTDETSDVPWPMVVDGVRAETRAEACLRMVRSIDAAMSPKDPPAVLIKGAGLRAAGIYEPGERDFVDADLVVDPGQVARVVGLCREAGFECTLTSPPNYEAAQASDGRLGFLEIHTALPGDAGQAEGPPWAAVVAASSPAAEDVGLRHVRVLRGQPAREVAGHHFFRHHDGDPLYALRTLQDLSRLDVDVRGEELPGSDASFEWYRAVRVRAVTQGLGQVAAEVRSGCLENGGRAEKFLGNLSAVIELKRSADAVFAANVERWTAMQGGWAARIRFVTGRALAVEPGASLASRLMRPARLAARWAVARVRYPGVGMVSSVHGEWMGFLGAMP